VSVRPTRRDFLQLSASGLSAAIAGPALALPASGVADASRRRYQFVQIDVFSATRLQGNPLAVFPDARGLSDAEMQGIARETHLQETTFVFPREPGVEREQGVKVRIFTPDEEIPFGGHPTLGTAMVLRNRMLPESGVAESIRDITLDLKVGKIPVTFTVDASGKTFGEMHQVDPVFGAVHERETVASIVGVKATDITDEYPIQNVSTGLLYAIVPLRELRTLHSLRPDNQRILEYFERRKEDAVFYYVTRDTHDPAVGLRSRGLFPGAEDPATGSAAGCTAAWMVRYGIAKSAATVRIDQGVEINRPSQIFVRAERRGDKVLNVRVGGHAIEISEGHLFL
jgi:trans-2,3-dihydro-3-hydroxyanthranilate isomerase